MKVRTTGSGHAHVVQRMPELSPDWEPKLPRAAGPPLHHLSTAALKTALQVPGPLVPVFDGFSCSTLVSAD